MDNKIEYSNDLTKKQKEFLRLLASGKSVQEAYALAGYKGKNADSAYVLSSRLKDKLSQILEQNGFNRNKFVVELLNLVSLPLSDTQKSVTVDQKIKILRLFRDSLPSINREPTFTRFVIVNGAIETKKPAVIDAEIVNSDNQVSNDLEVAKSQINSTIEIEKNGH